MMGGDYAPLEAVKGAAAFLADNGHDAHLVLIGDQDAITEQMTGHSLPEGKYSLVHAPLFFFFQAEDGIRDTGM